VVRQNIAIPFPRNLICEVFGREVAPEELPLDIEASVEFVLENAMSERDAFILILRYLRNMSIREIAAYYGLSYSRIRQIIKKAQRKLRHPRYRNYLLDGCTKVEQEAAAALERQANFKPPADPRPRAAIAEIADPHIRIDAIMARGGLNQIAWLDLPVRVHNCLVFKQVENVWQLCALTPTTLLRFRNLGAGTLAVIQEKLFVHNLSLDDGTIESNAQAWDYAEQQYAALAADQR
jgi:predicted DNA-binding protein YlxM (UPF0122 family)